MTELTDQIWSEKFRPARLEDLILEGKDKLKKFLDSPQSLPSFIFYSSRPGTGKTSCAKIIINMLDCDHLTINSSDERGIDTIRDKVNRFAMGLSSNSSKRCVFLDEADGLTSQAQNSLRNLMETYSKGCFFIFSCNDINKIIQPIRSRCTEINFENPPEREVVEFLQSICKKEDVDLSYIEGLVGYYYPDIRSMVKVLQECKLAGKSPVTLREDFELFLDALKQHNVDYIIQSIYSTNFNIIAWNKWYFKQVFQNSEQLGLEKCVAISELLADTEKNWNQGANLEIIFLANMFKLMKVYDEEKTTVS